METLLGPPFAARSRLECVTVCKSVQNCTGVDYVPEKQWCHTVAHADAILP